MRYWEYAKGKLAIGEEECKDGGGWVIVIDKPYLLYEIPRDGGEASLYERYDTFDEAFADSKKLT